MIQISGTYNNGSIILDKTITVKKAVKVLVSFEDEDISTEKSNLSVSDFSFIKSRELLKDVKGKLSEAVIEDRRSQL